MAKSETKPAVRANERKDVVSQDQEVDSFLDKLKSMPVVRGKPTSGRLIFAMDATMSRQPTWDRALNIQAEMFLEAGRIGGLDVQLVYFRGFGECRASKWVDDATQLANLMTRVDCRGGNTQIGKVLQHIKREAEKAPVDAVIYIGDCMEENIDQLCQRAGEVSLHGVPIFLFQEGRDTLAEQAFREIARLTRGAYCRFDSSSARQLRDLLAAVAVYAAGGRKALEQHDAGRSATGRLLLEQLG
jgi:hypothetical protein